MPKEITQICSFEIKNIFPEFEEIMIKNLTKKTEESFQIIKEWLLTKKFSPAKCRVILALLCAYTTNNLKVKSELEKTKAIRFYDNDEVIYVSKNGMGKRVKVNLTNGIFKDLIFL